MQTVVATDRLWDASHSDNSQGRNFHVSGLEFLRCVFRDHSAMHGIFDNVDFVSCDFLDGINVAKTVFKNVSFTDCTFEEFFFNKAYFDGVQFRDCHFRHSGFNKTSFGTPTSFEDCIFNGTKFSLTRARLFDFKECSFSGLAIDLGDLDWQADQSHSQFSPAFYLARGLSSCRDLDGSLVKAIGDFKFEKAKIIEWLSSNSIGEDGRYFLKHHAEFLQENIEPALKLDPLEDEVNHPLQKAILQELDQRLISMIGARNVSLDNLTPREFEELIAALLRKMGYLAKLTAATRDGGYDIFAIHQGPGGMNSSMLVECKRYAPQRKVGLGIVRGLYTLRCQQEAGTALIATTSHFSADVHQYKEKLYNLQLADRDRILAWCTEWGNS